MKAIASSRHAVQIIDLEKMSVVDTIRTGSYETLYYGITWNDDFMYLAKRCECCHTQCVEVLDRDLEYVNSIVKAAYEDALLWDVHQIQWYGGRLWITSSGKNSILSCDRDGNDINVWYPNPEVQGRDVNHFNSVWFHAGMVYVVAHNKAPSDVWIFKYPELTLVDKHRVGHNAHNIVVVDNNEIVLDSYHGRAVYYAGGAVSLPDNGYPRGLAVKLGKETADNVFVVGNSTNCDREHRSAKKDGSIQVYDGNWNLIGNIMLDMGQVYEIRLLDVSDYAHHGMPWRGKYGLNS